VVDYRILYDQGLGNSVYTVLADGVTTNYFTTDSTLTPGYTYSFKVESRHSAGYSLPSAAFSVVAA
jgi:hypothetical protein